jgi:hypothetical protein
MNANFFAQKAKRCWLQKTRLLDLPRNKPNGAGCKVKCPVNNYILLKIEQRLCLNHCDLVGESGKGMDVQFAASGLEINVAERLQIIDFQVREFNEHAAISRKPLKVDMALAIQIGTHLLDLKIGHVAYSPAQSAFMGPRAAELETFDQTSMWKQLAGRAYDLAQARILGKHANNVGAAGNPDKSLVLVGLQLPLGINLEKLRMQRSLKEAECQLFNCYIDLWRFHITSPKTKTPDFCVLYKNRHTDSSLISVLIRRVTALMGRLFRKLRSLKE